MRVYSSRRSCAPRNDGREFQCGSGGATSVRAMALRACHCSSAQRARYSHSASSGLLSRPMRTSAVSICCACASLRAKATPLTAMTASEAVPAYKNALRSLIVVAKECVKRAAHSRHGVAKRARQIALARALLNRDLRIVAKQRAERGVRVCQYAQNRGLRIAARNERIDRKIKLAKRRGAHLLRQRPHAGPIGRRCLLAHKLVVLLNDQTAIRARCHELAQRRKVPLLHKSARKRQPFESAKSAERNVVAQHVDYHIEKDAAHVAGLRYAQRHGVDKQSVALATLPALTLANSGLYRQ